MDPFLLLVFVVFYLTLYFLIVIHEIGHLFIAKATNVLCRSFTIGAGPKLFSFRIGETFYHFHLLPIVGGVEMAGEDGSDFDGARGKRVFVVLNRARKVTKLYIDPKTTLKDVNQIEGQIINFYLSGSMRLRIRTLDGKHRTFVLHDNAHIFEGEQDIQMAPVNRRFWSKKAWKKMMIILGGPFFNISAAMITFMLLGIFIGAPGESLTISKVHVNSVAQRAGIQSGDTIIGVNGEVVHTKQEYETAIKKVPETSPYHLTVERDNQSMRFDVQHLIHTEKTAPTLGFETARSYGAIEGLRFGIMTTSTLVLSIVLGMKALFTFDFANLTLGGPLSIFQQNSQVMTTSPYESVLLFIAMMSLNLGILNLFPIPLLDGGRLVHVFIEKVTHKKMSRRAETWMTLFGIVILFIFIVLLTFSDIQKIINH